MRARRREGGPCRAHHTSSGCDSRLVPAGDVSERVLLLRRGFVRGVQASKLFRCDYLLHDGDGDCDCDCDCDALR